MFKDIDVQDMYRYFQKKCYRRTDILLVAGLLVDNNTKPLIHLRLIKAFVANWNDIRLLL